MQTERINVGFELHKAYSKKKCSNCGTKFEFMDFELQNYIDGNIVWKKEQLAYCRNCNKLFFRSDYDEFVYKHPGYFDYKLVQHIKEKKEKSKIAGQSEIKEKKKGSQLKQTELELGLGIEQTELNFDQIKEKKSEIKENVLPEADFFVRDSVCSCSKKRHKIIDFLAEVDVICSNGKIIKKSFLASYCEDCKLYFMYDDEYKKLRKSGVPLCSIYEYSKYIKTKNTGKIKLKPESLLHSFGYNVGATDNLSTKQRNKILLFVINNGIMGKHEILYLLNYLVDFRKNDKKQAKAVAKWKTDINYLQNMNIEREKTVEVNSIRIINKIKR